MAELALFVLLLIASFAGMLLLWRAIEDETTDPPSMRRDDAERAVRQDSEDE